MEPVKNPHDPLLPMNQESRLSDIDENRWSIINFCTTCLQKIGSCFKKALAFIAFPFTYIKNRFYPTVIKKEDFKSCLDFSIQQESTTYKDVITSHFKKLEEVMCDSSTQKHLETLKEGIISAVSRNSQEIILMDRVDKIVLSLGREIFFLKTFLKKTEKLCYSLISSRDNGLVVTLYVNNIEETTNVSALQKMSYLLRTNTFEENLDFKDIRSKEKTPIRSFKIPLSEFSPIKAGMPAPVSSQE